MFAEELAPDAFNAIEPGKRGAGAAHAAGLADSYDDIEGYYTFTVCGLGQAYVTRLVSLKRLAQKSTIVALCQ